MASVTRGRRAGGRRPHQAGREPSTAPNRRVRARSEPLTGLPLDVSENDKSMQGEGDWKRFGT